MNKDQIEGKVKQFSGKVKEKWGKLTDDDLTVIAGKKDQLVGKVQERYGIALEEAQKQVDEFNHAYGREEDTRDDEIADDASLRHGKAHGAGKH